jgi:hypothetical protein
MINIRNTKKLSKLTALYKSMNNVSELITLDNRLTSLLWLADSTETRRDIAMLLRNVKQKTFKAASL